MTHRADPHPSVSHIRRRLFLLLVQAFGAVVLLTVILLLGLVSFVINSDVARIGVTFTIGLPLQSFYQGRGSWAGWILCCRTCRPKSGQTPSGSGGILSCSTKPAAC